MAKHLIHTRADATCRVQRPSNAGLALVLASTVRMASLGLLTVLTACGGSQLSTRVVYDAVGEAEEYGAPKNTKYTAELDAGREYGRVTVFRASECAVIPVTITQGYQETLEGKKVIERSPLTKSQTAGAPKGTVPCDQTYANEVEVLLLVAGNKYSLGKTNAQGQVAANLMTVLQVGTFEDLPDAASIQLRPRAAAPAVDAGQVSLSQLKKLDGRTEELLGKLTAILEKGETGQNNEDISRSYEIYAQLQDMSPGDPRVIGISARFWEVFYGRKKEEDRARLGKTLEALGEARETLKAMGDAAIPIYVQAAVSSGSLDQRALEWSSLRLISALKGAPTVCAAGFTFAGVPTYGWPAEARLAAQYTHFGYGPEHAAVIQGACRTF